MKFLRIPLFFLLTEVLKSCSGAKVLGIVSIASKSHHFILERIAVELTNRGHDVTLMTTFQQSKPIPRLNEIMLPDLHPKLMSLLTTGSKDNVNGTSNAIQMRKISKWIYPFMLPIVGPLFSDLFLSTPQLQELIKSDEKYDLIIGETFFIENVLSGLSHKFKAPIVAIAGSIPGLYVNYPVGNPMPGAYIPDPISGYSDRMNFWQRLENTVYTSLLEISYRSFYMSRQNSIMRKYFGDHLPHLSNIYTNTSLVLVNYHYSLAFPRPLMPNMIEIGGYHISPPKPLPIDLQTYMNNSKEGVILFSMGSHIKSASLPKETIKATLNAFSKLNQDIIWKFEDETLSNVPKNVKILKWVPQTDILAHPNLKVFVTHGGILSTTEAVVRGVPIVGIPVTGDQPTNMKYTTAAGFGVTLDYDELNEETLYEAITEVLNNPKYRESVKRGSELILDRPLPALDTTIYWIEYVIRHKGAPHLKSAAADISWYQLYLLDVLGFIFIASTCFIIAAIKLIKFLIKGILRLFRRKSVETSKKNN